MTMAVGTDLRIVTLADRPDLAGAIPGVLSSRWPEFMLAGRPGHHADLTALAMAIPRHQILLLDPADGVVGVGLSVPLHWDGTEAGLPAGWDAAIDASAELRARGGTPNAVCALSITLTPAAAGQGLAARMIVGLREAAAAAGASALIAPVRPVLKSRYPLVPMAEYVTWRTDDGRVFDPWLRLHLAVGGEQHGIAYPSMTITGSVAQWQEWTDQPMPASGEYIVPGGLVPLSVDRETDTGTYREPNVWVVHRALPPG